MTDLHRSDPDPLDRESELKLAREIRHLESGIMPSRDLWKGIERRIMDHPQKPARSRHPDWMPWGIAASLLIAASALVLNILQMDTTSGGFISAERGYDEMRIEYQRVRNPMLEEFSRVNRNLDEQTLQDLYRNLDILGQARRTLEDEIRRSPENQRLVESLMRVHQQELEVLKQDYIHSGRYL